MNKPATESIANAIQVNNPVQYKVLHEVSEQQREAMQKQKDMERGFIEMHCIELNKNFTFCKTTIIEKIKEAVKMGYRVYISNSIPSGFSNNGPVKFPLRYKSVDSYKDKKVLRCSFIESLHKEIMKELSGYVYSGIIIMKQKRVELTPKTESK